MVRREEWMNDASIPVLEVLDRADIAVTAGAIQLELERTMKRPPSRSTITRALRGLREHDYIQKVREDSIYYELTEEGRKCLHEL